MELNDATLLQEHQVFNFTFLLREIGFYGDLEADYLN